MKRDKPVVQMRKLVGQQIQLSNYTGLSNGVFVGSLDTASANLSPQAQDGAASATMQVMAYDNALSPTVPTASTQSIITPSGAIYASDDATNDQILLRHSPLADPLTCLYCF